MCKYVKEKSLQIDVIKKPPKWCLTFKIFCGKILQGDFGFDIFKTNQIWIENFRFFATYKRKGTDPSYGEMIDCTSSVKSATRIDRISVKSLLVLRRKTDYWWESCEL